MIRPAVPDDAGACARVHVRGWQQAYRQLAPGVAGLRVEDRLPRWRDTLEGREEGTVLVAEVDGEVVGLAGVVEARGELALLYLDAAHQGAGLGARLHDAALDLLRAAGCRKAELWVLEGNHRARAFYAARGWRPDGRRQEVDIAGTPLVELRLTQPLAAPRRSGDRGEGAAPGEPR